MKHTLCLLLSCTMLAAVVSAQAGSRDSSFGINGVVITSFINQAYAYAVAVQSNDQIIVAGTTATSNNNDFALARYNENGSTDSAFGTNGKILTDFNHFQDEILDIAVQPDGKILAAGESNSGSNYDFALARYKTNGTPDNSFGNGGKVTTDFSGTQDIGYAMALQTDGKIIVAGQTHKINGLTIRFALARYNVNGSLDTSFGVGGRTATLIGSTCEANDVVVQPDGKIIVAGTAYNDNNYDVAIARYNADGSLDKSFGKKGKDSFAIGMADDVAKAIALQPDGKIVLAGYTDVGGFNNDFFVLRLTTDGKRDASFGSNGQTVTGIQPGYDDYGNALAMQADGKIVVAGQTINIERFSDFAVVRYKANGSLDKTFGNSGIVVTKIGAYSDDGYAVALQNDGKILVSGDSFTTDTKVGFATVRYNPTTSPIRKKLQKPAVGNISVAAY